MEQQLAELFSLMPNLIRELDAIKVRSETFSKATKARFNIFTTLRNAHDELGLHSKFISLLLDANGHHDCGRLFLDLFIQTLIDLQVCNNSDEIANDEIFHDYKFDQLKKVEREKRNDYGQIDIGLIFEDSVLLIENKIYAYEQKGQIFRYVQYAKSLCKSNYVVLYLTLNGEISLTAGECMDKYLRISYSEHILEWLERCLEKTYKYPHINNVIRQYKDVVSNLVNKNPLMEIGMQEIKELIQKYPQIIEYADEIKSSVDGFKTERVNKLWLLLKDEIVKISAITEVNHKKTHQGWYLDPSYSLTDSFPIFVQKAEIDIKSIYCGICLHRFQDRSDLRTKHKVLFDNLSNAIEKNGSFEKLHGANDGWPCGVIKLAVMNDEWFKKLLYGNSDDILKAEAVRMSKLIAEYAALVKVTKI